MRAKAPNPIDIYVGGRVRARRTKLSMSQETLGDAVGITFQQIQKYEKGTNRIGASRLQHIARVLTVPIAFFFEDPPGGVPSTNGADRSDDGSILTFLESKEGKQLNTAFVSISNAKLRRGVVAFVRLLAETEDD